MDHVLMDSVFVVNGLVNGQAVNLPNAKRNVVQMENALKENANVFWTLGYGQSAIVLAKHIAENMELALGNSVYAANGLVNGQNVDLLDVQEAVGKMEYVTREHANVF